ncbi:MAG: rRNA maturation RNase YbeY [Rhodospirillales bacterium]|jgi:probable rRNA maturation factor|nr:rRNA maturation RNase YbeY [Rhodospirillales bacterium]
MTSVDAGTAPGLAVDVTICAEGWRQGLAEAEDVCRHAARAAFAGAGVRLDRRSEVSLLLADDARVRSLNRDYRGRDVATNVLAFEGETVEEDSVDGAPAVLGDVVVAYETAAAEAAATGKRLAEHLSLLVVHGMLHLLGFDHQTDEAAERMERLEATILSSLSGTGFHAGSSQE